MCGAGGWRKRNGMGKKDRNERKVCTLKNWKNREEIAEADKKNYLFTIFSTAKAALPVQYERTVYKMKGDPYFSRSKTNYF